MFTSTQDILKIKVSGFFLTRKSKIHFLYKTVDSLYFSCSLLNSTIPNRASELYFSSFSLFFFQRKEGTCWLLVIVQIHVSILPVYPLEYRGKFSISLEKRKICFLFSKPVSSNTLWGSILYEKYKGTQKGQIKMIKVN